MSRFMKFWRLDRREKLLFCEALVLHLFAGLLLKMVPFRRIPVLFRSRQFGTPAQAESCTPMFHDEVGSGGEEDQSRFDVSEQQAEIVEKIRVAVQRAGWISPWRNRCLVSSLAARCMMNHMKIPSSLSLGLTRQQDGKIIAHAWLKAAGCEIVERRGEYTELYKF